MPSLPSDARSRHMLPALSLAIIGLTLPRAAAADDLRALLEAVTHNARAPRPLRADVRIEREGAAPETAVLLTRGLVVYVETRRGTRALIRPGKVLLPGRRGPVRAPLGAPLDDTGLLLEDLVPFTPGSLAVPQVSDEGPAGTVVTGAPALASTYALLVDTIDPARGLIVRTKYYQGSTTNLVKMSRVGTPVEIAGRWRPGDLGLETFRPPATTRLVFTWREAPETPAQLFTPAGLRAPSPVSWPAP